MVRLSGAPHLLPMVRALSRAQRPGEVVEPGQPPTATAHSRTRQDFTRPFLT
jgi:hypothetical protein